MAEAPGEFEESEYDQEMEPEEDHESLREQVQGLREKDAILEPGIFKLFEDFIDLGGEQRSAVRHLASGYKGGPLMINSLIDWLHSAGCRKKEIQTLAEEHLKSLILKHFDPKKADLIFTEEGSTPDWLEDIVGFPTWRELFYQLADQYPDCLMLKFTIKLISDAGYQGEITSVATAAHQPEVFCGLIKTLLIDIITANPNDIDGHFHELCSLVCHSQHTYFYCQATIRTIEQRHPEYKSFTQWLSGEIQKHAMHKSLDVTTMTLHFNGVGSHSRIFEAMGSMLSRNALNPADVSTLYKCYTEEDKPSVSYLRNAQFLDLLVQALFRPGGNINPDHRDKYTYLLAYAVSVYELDHHHDNDYNGDTVAIVTDDLASTQDAIETAHVIYNSSRDLYTELLTKISTLFKCIRYPIVSMGVLRWVESILTDQSFFELSTETSSLFLVLLDEIASCHPLQHQFVFQLLKRLLETSDVSSEVGQLEVKRTLLDHMIHLFCCGHVLPVTHYINYCMNTDILDHSLIRYFVMEVLNMISPPYTQEFTTAFLPLLQNDEITSTLVSATKDDVVSVFMANCPRKSTKKKKKSKAK